MRETTSASEIQSSQHLSRTTGSISLHVSSHCGEAQRRGAISPRFAVPTFTLRWGYWRQYLDVRSTKHHQEINDTMLKTKAIYDTPGQLVERRASPPCFTFFIRLVLRSTIMALSKSARSRTALRRTRRCDPPLLFSAAQTSHSGLSMCPSKGNPSNAPTLRCQLKDGQKGGGRRRKNRLHASSTAKGGEAGRGEWEKRDNSLLRTLVDNGRPRQECRYESPKSSPCIVSSCVLAAASGTYGCHQCFSPNAKRKEKGAEINARITTVDQQQENYHSYVHEFGRCLNTGRPGTCAEFRCLASDMLCHAESTLRAAMVRPTQLCQPYGWLVLPPCAALTGP
ncbi:hypothetical protein J3F83DRAFT_622529 [Trichoderma novae-zelandiae]